MPKISIITFVRSVAVYSFLAVLISCRSSIGETTMTGISVLPEPKEATLLEGWYKLPEEIGVAVEGFHLEALIKEHGQDMFRFGGRNCVFSETGDIVLAIEKDASIEALEGYRLKVHSDGITIKASQPAGVFYAFMSLRQLAMTAASNQSSVTGLKLPFVEIDDAPRYGYRGLMLDPARHFLPVEDLKKYIDMMAFYKFNRLHLHLTDDQGWRIEIEGYPKLIEIGSKRKGTNDIPKPHQGHYSKAELKELVQYAQSRFVAIVPEIDMPGHNLAALAAYPDLACFPKDFEVRTIPGVSHEIMCAGKPQVYEFYKTVLNEVAEIFPHPQIHLGGDEAPTTRWERCSHCQNTMRQQGLKDEEELMSHFFSNIETLIQPLDREPIFWFENSVSDYPDGGTVFLWRNENPKETMRNIKARGLKMINSYGRRAYFDYPQWEGDGPITSWMPILDLEQAYGFEPSFGLFEDDGNLVMGVEACLWGEHMPNIEKVFYMTYPRAMALSEAGWTSKDKRSWERFKEKLPTHLNYLLRQGVLYRPPVELSLEIELTK